MYLLKAAQYPLILPLLEDSAPGALGYANNVARSVAEGHSPGRMWVDNEQEPRSALVADTGSWLILLGTAPTPLFLSDLQALLDQTIAPEAAGSDQPYRKVVCSGPEWHEPMSRILAVASPKQLSRTLAERRAETRQFGEPQSPTQGQVVRIDEALLNNVGVENKEPLIEEILSTWTSTQDFVAHGFGYCFIESGRIVCFCCGEYAYNSTIGIGIATEAAYRRRGFAFRTARAFVSHCQERGIVPYWDAWTENAPSVALAGRLGFTPVASYDVVLCRFHTLSDTPFA